MRTACFVIRNFEVEVERARRYGLAHAPVVLGGSAHDRSPARRVSPEAVAEGVREGMPLREAAARCPRALFLSYDADAYEEASARVLAVLREYSHAVEPDGYGCAYLDASGWGRLPARLGLARALLRQVTTEAAYNAGVTISLAPTKFTARLAALRAAPGEALAVPEWMEPSFLEGFPVETLSEVTVLGEKNLRKLRRLGVRTLGEFAALPAAETKLQFGTEGRLARALALGEDPRPVSPPPAALELHARESFEPPVGDVETLRRVLGRQLGGLCGRLGLGVTSLLEVRLGLCTGEVLASPARLPVPSASHRDLSLAATRTLDRLLGTFPCRGDASEGIGIVEAQFLEVRLLEVSEDAGRQAVLWEEPGLKAASSSALARLRDQFGPDRLRRVVLLDPSSPLPGKQFALLEAVA